jgi:ankyrin repeat protein
MVKKKQRQEVLFDAADNGDVERIRNLIAVGASPNCRNAYLQTPLFRAMLLPPPEKRLEAMRVLLELGANPNSKDDVKCTPFSCLLGIDDEAENLTAIKLLLKHGGSLENKCSHFSGPLGFAVEVDHFVSVKNLLSVGANPNSSIRCIPPDLRRTPLGLAVSYLNRWPIARLLVESGADPNFPDGLGNTPLFRSGFNCPKTIEICRWLIENGANVNARNRSGNTPLHYAVWGIKFPLEFCKLLIENGASINARNKEGFTPVQYCRESIHREREKIREYLVAKGGQ